MDLYRSIHLKEDLIIENLYTIHYFEYMNDFVFRGESHDFWEFLYVDKGAVDITAGTIVHHLKKGDIVFHKPNEFHAVTADGQIAPNLIVMSFECNSRYMKFFEKKILQLDDSERNLLASIITEAKESFHERLDDPWQKEMLLNSDAPFASLQLIKIYLEQFLLHILRRYQNPLVPSVKNSIKISRTTKRRNDEDTFNRICSYLESHLSEQLTIEDICKANLIGRSPLQKLFQEYSGLGIIEFFSNMKIESAKNLMRTNRMNFTQISEQLGYSSIHYFSRQFKKTTGMTPSEYASSIKALSERNN